MFICTECLLNIESLKCKHTDKLPSKQCKRTHIKTILLTNISEQRWQMSGRDTKFGSSSRFDPHPCQEEEKAISSHLVAVARPSDYPQTIPSTAVPQPQLQPEPQPISQLQAHSFLQPPSEPHAQGCTARLPPAGTRPGEA